MKIYISSLCLKDKKIKDAILLLKERGFSYIELTGGSDYYAGLEEDLLDLHRSSGIDFLMHNYFPPPKEHFVINLASLDNDVYYKSIGHLKRALDLCRALDINKFGLHAGILMDLEVYQLGIPIVASQFYNRQAALNRFCAGYEKIRKYAGNINIYVENHILRSSVLEKLGDEIPLMLTCFQDYLELRKRIDIIPLLDVAHLKVSSLTLGLDFSKELQSFSSYTDYLHIGDIGEENQEHQPFSKNSLLLKELQVLRLKDKTVTLEINGDISDIQRSFRLIEEVAE
ncbi:hypothetical protein D4R78_01765 [bacterium]|nr:MAG: hypothetical protein D4R78_01765 [bacterium]